MGLFRRIMLASVTEVIDIDTLPNTQKLYYTATAKVTPKSNSLGSPVIANKWDATTGEGVIVCKRDIEEIGNSAFTTKIELISIIIPDSVTKIGDYAFRQCSGLTSVTIGNGVTHIGYNAFKFCTGLTGINIPNSVTYIGTDAFGSCSGLTSVTMGNGVKTIDEKAFYECISLTSIVIPDSVTRINGNVFQNCSGLTSVTIPDSVTSIGVRAFRDCTSLTSVTIGNGVTSIGLELFFGCHSLISVHCKPQTPPFLQGDLLTSATLLQYIYVPMESVDAYKSATNWSKYADYIVGYDFEDGDEESGNLITFTIGGTEYQAEEGMTWGRMN